MLNDKAWLQEQVNTYPLRYIAKELGVSYSRVQKTVKDLEIVLPKRTKYFSTPESRKAKSEAVKAGLAKKYPDGRTGELASNWRGGKKQCLDCGQLLTRKDALRCKVCARKGDSNNNWRGGITPEHVSIRSSKEMKAWRTAVFERDNYTCQHCGARSGEGKIIILNADHIKPFAYYPDLRFDIDNGRTLCIECHKETETYAGKARSNNES